MAVISDVSMSFKSHSEPYFLILDLIMLLSSSLLVGRQEYTENFERFLPIFKASLLCDANFFIFKILLVLLIVIT